MAVIIRVWGWFKGKSRLDLNDNVPRTDLLDVNSLISTSLLRITLLFAQPDKNNANDLLLNYYQERGFKVYYS